MTALCATAADGTIAIAAPDDRGARCADRRRAADDGRGVPDARRCWSRCGLSSTPPCAANWRRFEAAAAGISQGAPPGLESGRPGALQPGGEPQGRGGAVRLPGHLHARACRRTARRSTCRCRRRWRSSRMAGARRNCCRCCCRCSAPRSSATGCARWWTRARSIIRCAGRRPTPVVPHRRAQARGRRHRRARAGDLAGRPARRDRRSRPASARVRRRCSAMDALLDFSMEVTLDGERLERGRDQGAAARWRRPAADPRPLGRGRPQEARPPAGALRGHRAGGGAKRPALRRGDAPGGGRVARRRGRSPPMPTGRNWSPARGWPKRCRGCASRKGWRRSIPGRNSRPRCGPISRPACAGCICSPGSGLGACLADDMGLGKTIQVLSLLLVLKREQRRRGRAPACWSLRRRCWPTGRRKSSASPRACAC